MNVNVKFEYIEKYLPTPRCRKYRTREVKGTCTVTVREAPIGKLVPAFGVEQYIWGEVPSIENDVIFSNEGSLWKLSRANRYYADKSWYDLAPCTSEFLARHLEPNRYEIHDFNTDTERIKAYIQSQADRFLICDGKLYEETTEPRLKGECDMFIVIKSEHYDCTNLICKKDTLEEAAAAVRESIAQRINKNYHTGLTGADITHENEERYRFSFDFDENCPADNSEPRVHATYDFWKGDDEESVEWAVFEVTTDKPFFLLSYEEYESIELTGFYGSFDEAFEEMKELIAESVNDVFDEDATADDVEDMEDYNVFVHSNKDSKDSGAPLAFASFCDDYPNREWTVFHI